MGILGIIGNVGAGTLIFGVGGLYAYRAYHLRNMPLAKDAMRALEDDDKLSTVIGKPIKFNNKPDPISAPIDKVEIMFTGKNYDGMLYAAAGTDDDGKYMMDYCSVVINGHRRAVKMPVHKHNTDETEVS